MGCKTRMMMMDYRRNAEPLSHTESQAMVVCRIIFGQGVKIEHIGLMLMDNGAKGESV